jgi:hypothetical protein
LKEKLIKAYSHFSGAVFQFITRLGQVFSACDVDDKKKIKISVGNEFARILMIENSFRSLPYLHFTCF